MSMATPRSFSAAQRLVIEYYRAKLNLMHVINARWAAASAVDLFQKPYARPRRKTPPIFKLAKSLSLATGEEKLAGYHWVPEQPMGKKMLIVHGFAGSCYSFDRYIGPALAKGYEVIAFDAPGHGKSTGNRLNLISYKWALEDILKHHGLFDAYLTHSLGGMSLMLALENYQQQHHGRIALIAPLVEAQRSAESFLGFLQVPPRLRSEFEREITERAGHPLTWFSMPRLVQHHRGKILWIHDRDDDTTPFEDVAPFQQNLPDHVELMVTSGLGHSRIYRDNAVRKKVLEIL
jgi:pimeloyl-ACP methyl ester carboxylesterase